VPVGSALLLKEDESNGIKIWRERENEMGARHQKKRKRSELMGQDKDTKKTRETGLQCLVNRRKFVGGMERDQEEERQGAGKLRQKKSNETEKRNMRWRESCGISKGEQTWRQKENGSPLKAHEVWHPKGRTAEGSGGGRRTFFIKKRRLGQDKTDKVMVSGCTLWGGNCTIERHG